MHARNDVLKTSYSSYSNNPTARRQGDASEYRPVEKVPETTFPIDPDLPCDSSITRGAEARKRYEPPVAMGFLRVSMDSIPLQIWEGTVVDVDHAARMMRVLLEAKIGEKSQHTGEIDLQWVSEQDQDLVCPGAVFYLTLFKRTKRSGIENAQELRFRRRPSWSSAQLRQINEDAETLLAKMAALPMSE